MILRENELRTIIKNILKEGIKLYDEFSEDRKVYVTNKGEFLRKIFMPEMKKMGLKDFVIRRIELQDVEQYFPSHGLGTDLDTIKRNNWICDCLYEIHGFKIYFNFLIINNELILKIHPHTVTVLSSFSDHLIKFKRRVLDLKADIIKDNLKFDDQIKKKFSRAQFKDRYSIDREKLQDYLRHFQNLLTWIDSIAEVEAMEFPEFVIEDFDEKEEELIIKTKKSLSNIINEPLSEKN